MKIILLIVSAVLMLSACSSVPYTNRSQLMLTSEKSEIKLGEDAFSEVKNKEPESKDQTMNAAVKRVGTNISRIAGKDEYDWEFLVVQSQDANAYCLPGGKVVVYTGLFKYIKNDAGLATVLGHEIGHAIARHAGERMSQAYLESAGGVAVDTTLSVVGLPSVFGSAYGVATMLGLDLPYSRTQEYEADHIGLMLMAKAGYDPEVAVIFWNDFSKESEYGPVREFFATHPMTDKRIDEIKKLMPDAKKIYDSDSNKLGTGQPIKVEASALQVPKPQKKKNTPQ